jgi:uncharacterized membrane protein YhaH (DUF805 family)
MSEVWYYANGTNRVGPLSKQHLIQSLSLMPEPAKTFVWRTGFSDWRKASELAELFPYVAKPPLLPPGLPHEPSALDNSGLADLRGLSGEHQAGGISVWNALFSFRGRLNRIQYALIFILAYIGPLLITVAISEELNNGSVYLQIALFVLIFLMIWVFFASLAKRLHDTDRPGTYCLFVFFPVVGGLTVLIMLFARGTQGTNQYGPPS